MQLTIFQEGDNVGEFPSRHRDLGDAAPRGVSVDLDGDRAVRPFVVHAQAVGAVPSALGAALVHHYVVKVVLGRMSTLLANVGHDDLHPGPMWCRRRSG